MIKFVKTSLRFTKEYYALCDIDLSVQAGEKVALVGELESGKTSLLRVLAGLEKSYTGEVFVDDRELKSLDYKYDLQVGYLPFNAIFFNKKTVCENMMYAINLRNKDISEMEKNEKISEALEKVGMVYLKDIRIYMLSFYEKLMVSFARLLLRNIDYLLVDNVLGELNDEQKTQFKSVLKNYFNDANITCIIASESLSYVEDMGLRIVNMKAGCIQN